MELTAALAGAEAEAEARTIFQIRAMAELAVAREAAAVLPMELAAMVEPVEEEAAAEG